MTPFVANQTRQLVLEVNAVPEPTMIVLLLTGAVAYGSARWRRGRR